MEFEQNYDNPCWPESVPRYPYQNNSYLLIDQQQKLIDPVFQVCSLTKTAVTCAIIAGNCFRIWAGLSLSISA